VTLIHYIFQKTRSCLLIYIVFLTSTLPVQAEPIHIPEPDPPYVIPVPEKSVLPDMLHPLAAPTTEWTYHKSIDGEHPDQNEQQLLWLMNRARSNPTLEGIWLAEMNEPNVASARSYFHVDLDLLKSEFSAIPSKPPAAFDIRLYNAAKTHSNDLITRDAQDHNNQFNRISDAGFHYWGGRGNVYSYTKSAIHGHAGFNIDWGGNDGTGMQTERGHRKAIMSTDGDYSNVGLAMVRESDPDTQVGAFVTTGNYCRANTTYSNHFNRFIVGTVWKDDNSNGIYDPGEGISQVSVIPNQGTYYAVTAKSGGYAIPVDSGTYSVTFSGPAINGTEIKAVTVGDDSILLNYLYTDTVFVIPEAITLQAASITRGSADLSGTVNANGITCTYYFEYGQTNGYGETTDSYQTSENSQIAVTVSDLSANEDYHYRLVVTFDSNTIYGQDQLLSTVSQLSTQSSESSGGGGGGGCFIGSL